MKVSVIGAGTFGTALINALNKDNDLVLYSRNPQIVAQINETRKNEKYFPNKILSKKIRATSDTTEVRDSDAIFLCIPSYTIVDFVESLKPLPETIIVNGAKGFGVANKLIPEALKSVVSNEVISMKGPSFANEMIFDIPTAFTIAATDPKHFTLISGLFRKDLAVFDYTSDVSAVELLSIVKNVYAIIVGIVDAGYSSANVRFLTFTKALNEIHKLLEIFHFCPDTIFCYSGIGDFGLTALNDLSRNRTLGLLVGKGFLNSNIAHNTVVLEGMSAIGNLIEFIPSEKLNRFPLLCSLHDLFNNRTTIKKFVNNVIYN
jgi:glycerol-3-phosphate dehydrogenase (NAD(P)+)